MRTLLTLLAFASPVPPTTSPTAPLSCPMTIVRGAVCANLCPLETDRKWLCWSAAGAMSGCSGMFEGEMVTCVARCC